MRLINDDVIELVGGGDQTITIIGDPDYFPDFHNPYDDLYYDRGDSCDETPTEPRCVQTPPTPPVVSVTVNLHDATHKTFTYN